MIMGFPGRTNKYYTSWEVAERRDIDNAVRINIRNLRQEAMLEEMLKDPQSGFNTLVSMRVLRTLIRMRSVVTGRSTNVILSR